MRALLLLLLLTAVPAFAQIPNDNALQGITDAYQAEASGWAAVIKGYAFTVFWMLVVIDFTWTGIGLVTKRADFGDVVGEYLHRIFIIGFFLALLQFSGPWASAIVDSLRQLAGAAGGVGSINPADVFDKGLISTGAIMSKMSAWSPAKATVLGLIGIICIVVFALIAAELIFVLVTMWVILNAGIIMLAFGGSRWTQNYALNYYRTVLAVGLKLFVIQLIIGVGLNIILNWAQTIPEAPSWSEIFTVAGSVIILYALVKNIGQLVESLISGSGAASASGSGAVTGAIMASAAAIATAAGVGAAGVKSAAGGASGAKAAWELAGEGMKQGGGMTAAQTALSSIGGAIAGSSGASAGAKLGGMFSQVAGAAVEGGKSFGQDFKNQLKGDISAERGTLGGRMGEIMKDKKASMQRQSELNELGSDLSSPQTNTQEPITNDKSTSSSSGSAGESASAGSSTAAGATSTGPMVETPNSGGSTTSAAASDTASEAPSVQTTSTGTATSSATSQASGDLPPNGYISGVPGQENLGAYASMGDPKPSEPESPRSPKGITVTGQEEPKSSRSPKGITVTDSNS